MVRVALMAEKSAAVDSSTMNGVFGVLTSLQETVYGKPVRVTDGTFTVGVQVGRVTSLTASTYASRSPLSISLTTVMALSGMVGAAPGSVLTVIIEVNDAPGASAVSPTQRANPPNPGMGRVLESKHSSSPSELVKPEMVTLSCLMMNAVMNSPLQALGPALSVVEVHCPDVQEREISRLHGVSARVGRAIKERNATMTTERNWPPENEEC